MRFYFFKCTQDHILTKLRELDPNTSSLDLRESNIGDRTGAELVAMTQLFPQGLRSLDLSWNRLGLKSVQEIVAIIKALPQGLITLDFSFNHIGSKTDDELIEIFSAFKETSITKMRIENSISLRPEVWKLLNEILLNNKQKHSQAEQSQEPSLMV
ncbi:Leucine-rich repeat protein [Legionella moravica]|uniref:Leucine-rich repeat protein n=1 Tax=Legionella moravica TaxID=39962 RepID=A0A378JRS8_9GAMM|nr:hypothetical protein [Legionella moravica]KTD34698.1 Leucine-rich repeat protein [Legionella moravica]STX61304.1 Leucine-rich repeat protein [Legionella moravica]